MALAVHTSKPSEFDALLRDTALFKDLPEPIVARFAEVAQLRQAEKGKVLFIQGDDAASFYLILQGWVKLFRETIDGDEAVIDVLSTGHLFGEGAVFENDAYGYSAQVVEPMQYLVMPSSVLKQEIANSNQMALNMLSSMAQLRSQQSREIEHLNMQNAPQRIGCFLLRLCPAESDAQQVKLSLPYDKTLIASRLGMKPETFSRALAKLKEQTGIEINGSSVVINNMNTLVTYTCNRCSTSFPCDDLAD